MEDVSTVPPLDLTLSLALAVVDASPTPLLLLDANLKILAASRSFGRAFGVDPTRVKGASVFAIGKGEWNEPGLRSFLQATLVGDEEIEAFEFELERPGEPTRCLVLHADKVAYGDLTPVRGLLAVSDVTKARDDLREKEALAYHNAVLLQEVRHRVANSLQLIASVLLISARRAQSEETRGQLQNAHQRLMSVASLERHLTTVTVSEVHVGTYFEKLCASIVASMIRDPAQFRLRITADDSTIEPDTSVSLGLMVTELVINALKYAFQDRETGIITVSFAGAGNGWTLSVEDNGVGMPPKTPGARTGLGTSIVEALARQLKATVEILDAGPGTKVLIRKPAA